MDSRIGIRDLRSGGSLAVVLRSDRLDQTRGALDLTSGTGLLVGDRDDADLRVFQRLRLRYGPAGDLFAVAVLEIGCHDKSCVFVIKNSTGLSISGVFCRDMVDDLPLGLYADDNGGNDRSCQQHCSSDQKTLAVLFPKGIIARAAGLRAFVHLSTSLEFLCGMSVIPILKTSKYCPSYARANPMFIDLY